MRVIMGIECFAAVTEVLGAVRASEPLSIDFGDAAIAQRRGVDQGSEII